MKSSRRTHPVSLFFYLVSVQRQWIRPAIFFNIKYFCLSYLIPFPTYLKFKYFASTKMGPCICILDPRICYGFFSPVSKVARDQLFGDNLKKENISRKSNCCDSCFHTHTHTRALLPLMSLILLYAHFSFAGVLHILNAALQPIMNKYCRAKQTR